MRKIYKIIFICLTFCRAFASDDIPDILMEQSLDLFKHNNETYIALSFKSAPHWHTYWKNPGDAGLPTKIVVEGVQTSEVSWPVPRKFIETGDILAYGYEAPFTRFYKINEPLKDQNIKISSEWLICKHICIPGKSEFSAILGYEGLQIQKEWPFLLDQDELLKRYNQRPQSESFPQELDMTLKKSTHSNSLVLFYNLPASKAQNIKMLGLLTPYPHSLIDFKREKLFRDRQGHYYGRFTLDWDGEYSEPPVPLPSDGKFASPLSLKFLYNDPVTKTHKIIEKTFNAFELTGESELTELLKTMSPYDPLNVSNKVVAPKGIVQTEKVSSSLWSFLLFAFLGGLILNIMPCVLPVISLKLFGLIHHSTEPHSRILKHNLFYTLGVLVTFMLLGLSVIALKATGQQVGWGFQLQSPLFISITLIVLFTLTLNLFGLFEFATPGGKQLGNVKTTSGYGGDFLSGIIATVLSTPCSAPFLGTALTFAFTSETYMIFLIFFMIGLGLAFPFLMTGFFPSSIRFLPKPGLWMEHVKKFLGLTLLLTMVWLFDVFISLTNGNTAFLKLITCLIFLFFAFYVRKNITKKLIWVVFFFLISLAFLYGLIHETMNTTQEELVTQSHDLIHEKNKNTDLNWIPWSEEKMDELAKQKRFVFMDFTAKWCFTCKVNEKLVIQTDGFQKLGQKYDMVLLLADWTKYDPVIGTFLKKHGLVGVPAYFIQKPDGTLINLGETITLGKIEAALN